LRKLFAAFGLDVEYVGRPSDTKIPDAGAYQPRFRPWLLPAWQQAVDTFYAGKPEAPLALAGGQCIVFKAGAR
jgi:hypothetical protein